MGTNYYWFEREPCTACERPFQPIHIGKSSAGWTFGFHGTDEIRTEDDWRKKLETPNSYIEDEYGRRVGSGEFWSMVDSKRSSAHNHAREYPRDSWLDGKGNSFTSGEFS